MTKIILTILMLAGLSTATQGAEVSPTEHWWTSAGSYFKNEWSQSTGTDIFVPLDTWHNRDFYSSDQINHFNEIPEGLGFGKSYRDEESNWHGYYAMAFADSHYQTEPIVGYFYTKNLLGSVDRFSLGIGYTLFVTAREDSNYIPIPAAAPLITVGYKQITLNAAYLPGTIGVGNVGFVWMVYSFKE
jgi:palmitoyl transferase